MVNTVKVIVSWIIFNWTKEKGPPYSLNPILFAGTWNKYSNKTIPQLIKIMENKPIIVKYIVLVFYKNTILSKPSWKK